MKRLRIVATAVLAMVFGFAAWSWANPAPVSNLQAHFSSEDGTRTIRFLISWVPPAEAGNATVAIGVENPPLNWVDPFHYGAGWGPNGELYSKLFGVAEPTSSVEVSFTPITAGPIAYTYNINVWRTVGDWVTGTASTEVDLSNVVITSTPRPVQILSFQDNQLSWTNDQGGPVGSLVVTVTEDGAQLATATVSGDATNWPMPALGTGHVYVVTIQRTFEGKVSQVAKVTVSTVPIPPKVATTTKLTGPSSARHGRWFYLSGKVSPASAGAVKVYRWLLSHHKWRAKGSAKVTLRTSNYKWRWRTSIRGKWRFKATYPGSSTSKSSSSSYKIVQVK